MVCLVCEHLMRRELHLDLSCGQTTSRRSHGPVTVSFTISDSTDIFYTEITFSKTRESLTHINAAYGMRVYISINDKRAAFSTLFRRFQRRQRSRGHDMKLATTLTSSAYMFHCMQHVSFTFVYNSYLSRLSRFSRLSPQVLLSVMSSTSQYTIDIDSYNSLYVTPFPFANLLAKFHGQQPSWELRCGLGTRLAASLLFKFLDTLADTQTSSTCLI